MHASALRALEFDRIVELVADLAVTPTGRDRLAELQPSIDADDIREGAAGDNGRHPLSCRPSRLSAASAVGPGRRFSTRSNVEGRALEPLRLLGLADYLESIEQSRSVVSQARRSVAAPARARRARRVLQGRDRRRPAEDRSGGDVAGRCVAGAGGHPRSAAEAAREAADDARWIPARPRHRRSTCRIRSSPTATAATC